ncbi:HemK methyltransferase member 2 [Chytriomyces hyalinus]|nr:HemK methyltransferase member 2 [Chytriomyces hyalinus]
MKTPSLSHLRPSDYANVYEPSEDTFLLLDALEADADAGLLKEATVCLEVGSGSGCVSAFVGMLLKTCVLLATDINPHATSASLQTGVKNNVHIDPVLSHFATAFGSRLAGKVDLLIFNPPYVVTPSEEVGSSGIEAAWAGGVDGMEVTSKFLPLVNDLLSENGLFYLVTVRENKPLEIMREMRDSYGLFSKVVLTRRAGIEGLAIVRFSRTEF